MKPGLYNWQGGDINTPLSYTVKKDLKIKMSFRRRNCNIELGESQPKNFSDPLLGNPYRCFCAFDKYLNWEARW